MPGGADGPAFIVYENFRAILKWNRSDFFALTVGYLSDRIGGKNTVMFRNDRTGNIERSVHSRGLPWSSGQCLLAACETERPPPGAGPADLVPGSPPHHRRQAFGSGTYKVGKPYQVEGKWYYPKVDLAYDERGVASWYGPNFHGKKTANGEIFDMTLISAAHKTLPMPSVVRVTNLENGRSLIIRINDRGPFVRGRIIDLSRRAAELLGFSNKGTAMVQVRLLQDESRRAALEAGASGKT